jgi:hypothetical protein
MQIPGQCPSLADQTEKGCRRNSGQPLCFRSPLRVERFLRYDFLALLQLLCHQVCLPSLTEPLWGPRVYMHISGQCPRSGSGRGVCRNCANCGRRGMPPSSPGDATNQKGQGFVENFNAAVTDCTCGRGSSGGCGPLPAAVRPPTSPAWPAPALPAPSGARRTPFPCPG